MLLATSIFRVLVTRFDLLSATATNQDASSTTHTATMALVMMPDLVSQFVAALHPVVSTTALTILGAAVTFGPQALRSPGIEAARREIGEFAFHNGALLAHHQYLYWVDQSGEPYIAGKKLAGQDYSVWESEYAKFPRLGSQTIERPHAKVTYSWSLEAPQTSINQTLLQILLWLVFALFCAAVLGYLAQRFGNRNRFVPELTRELMGKYNEGKSQILSLTKRVFHRNDDILKTRKLVRRERKKKNAARTAILRMKSAMKSVHDREIREQQDKIDMLQQVLDSILESSRHANAEGEKAETDNAQAPSDFDQPESSTDPINGHEDAAVEGGDGNAEATGTADEEQDEKSPAVDEQNAGLGDDDPASAAEHDDSFATFDDQDAGTGEVDPRAAAHQDDGPSTPSEPEPRLDHNGKPWKQRVNRRRDGSVRTATHPDYTPPSDQSQSPAQGGRGRGGNRGVRGGRGRGNFGWRGGRNERGFGGRGGGYGPYDQGRGQ